MEKYRLAVVIPTYDSLDTLKVLIKNIINYTDDYSFYVIEDGQKQETIDWLKREKINTIFHKENKGIAPSWNDGLRMAIKDNCTHFAILNDDIELPPNWWEECKKIFDLDAHCVSIKPKSNCILVGWFFIIDKECIEKIGYFDEQFAPFCVEDDDYAYRIVNKRLKFGWVELNIFHHGSKTLKKIKKERPEFYEKVRQENNLKIAKKYPYKKFMI